MIPRLAKLEKKFDNQSDQDLQAEIERLQGERRTLARANPGPFPEDLNERFDELVEEARAQLERGLASAAGGALNLSPSPIAPGRSLSELASVWQVVHDLEFQKQVRAAIDSGSAPGLSKAKLTEKLGRLDDEIGAIETELRRREIELRRAEADSELISLGGGDRAA
jgi:hypothetical protein